MQGVRKRERERDLPKESSNLAQYAWHAAIKRAKTKAQWKRERERQRVNGTGDEKAHS